MNLEPPLAREIIQVAACICAKDGFLSESEEAKLFQLSQSLFGDLTPNEFEQILIDFFNSEDQIEDYLKRVDDPGSREIALQIAEQSASEDGLEIRENIALKKARLIWGIGIDA